MGCGVLWGLGHLWGWGGSYGGGCVSFPQICLGETASDEFHVVEVVPNEGGAVPLATLKPSVLPMVSGGGGGVGSGGGVEGGSGGAAGLCCPVFCFPVPGHAGRSGADASRHFPAPLGVRPGVHQRAARVQ